jgi:hypothetical protein
MIINLMKYKARTLILNLRNFTKMRFRHRMIST